MNIFLIERKNPEFLDFFCDLIVNYELIIYTAESKSQLSDYVIGALVINHFNVLIRNAVAFLSLFVAGAVSVCGGVNRKVAKSSSIFSYPT